MKTILRLATFIFIFSCTLSYGQISWSSEQNQIIEAIQLLSKTTAKNGSGPDAYAQYLHQDFNRWTLGSSKIFNKKEWVQGVESWFSDGWYVSNREQQYVEIRVEKDVANVRRIVTETYSGPKDESSTSKAALAEVWVKRQKNWTLHTVNVYPLDGN